jgi:hypothetical protein
MKERSRIWKEDDVTTSKLSPYSAEIMRKAIKDLHEDN